ncbi:hypothetical protein ACFSTD_19985 [Novosphingobium colocasiae]
MPIFFEIVAFRTPGFAGADDYRARREGIERGAARGGIAVLAGGDINVMADNVRDLARRVEIADLAIATDQTAQLAALVIQFMRGRHDRDDAHPGARGNHADVLPCRRAGVAGDPECGGDVDRRAQQRAQPDRDIGQRLVRNPTRFHVVGQHAVDQAESGQAGDADEHPRPANEKKPAITASCSNAPR